MAFIYGVFYCTSPFLVRSGSSKRFTVFLTTIPAIFSTIYHEKPGIGGMNYISLGIGLTGASQLNARYMDRIYVYLKKRNGGVGEPEFRLPSIVPGCLLFPFGLLLTGWAAEHKLHWVATDAVSVLPIVVRVWGKY